MLNKYIIGFLAEDTDKLVEFISKQDADNRAEEWCEVSADSVAMAKEQYECVFIETMGQAEYLRNKGLNCPVCGKSDGLAANTPRTHGTEMYQDVSCSCGAKWNDTFKLTGFIDLDTSGCQHNENKKMMEHVTDTFLTTISENLNRNATKEETEELLKILTQKVLDNSQFE